MAISVLPPDLVDGLDVRTVTPLSGGDIADAYRLDTSDGSLFCKTLTRPAEGFFAREAAGLRALAAFAPASMGVPDVVRVEETGLLLSWVDVGGRRTDETEAAFGRGLAALHRASAGAQGTFGAPDGDDGAGFLGSVRIDLTPEEEWPEYYLTRRLRPLVEQAVDAGRLDPQARRLLDRIAPRVADICGPAEPPMLVHGDLWGGNRLVDHAGRNWLIDPSAHFAHRELDLALMQLFGGFGQRAFAAYDEEHPLAEGWTDRVGWYQLPALLVHAVLFGGGYGTSALDVLRRHAPRT